MYLTMKAPLNSYACKTEAQAIEEAKLSQGQEGGIWIVVRIMASIKPGNQEVKMISGFTSMGDL